MDGGVPKKLEVGGGYDFFVILWCRGGGGFGIFSFLMTFLMITYFKSEPLFQFCLSIKVFYC